MGRSKVHAVCECSSNCRFVSTSDLRGHCTSHPPPTRTHPTVCQAISMSSVVNPPDEHADTRDGRGPLYRHLHRNTIAKPVPYGHGLFATGPISQGEAVYHNPDLYSQLLDADATAARSNYRILVLLDPSGAPRYSPFVPEIDAVAYINHSCDPACVFTPVDGTLLVTARRDICAGDQLTVDYGTCDADSAHSWAECACGAARCRRIVRPDDWLELAAAYGDHFTPVLAKRLREEVVSLPHCRAMADVYGAMPEWVAHTGYPLVPRRHPPAPEPPAAGMWYYYECLHQRLLDFAADVGAFTPCPKRVLVVGCGRGGAMQALGDRLAPPSGPTCEIIGMDVVGMNVYLCNRRLPQCRAVWGNVAALSACAWAPGLAGSVACVVGGSLLFSELVSVDETLFERAAAEVARVLCPGGWLLVADRVPRDRLPGLEAVLRRHGLQRTAWEELNAEMAQAYRRCLDHMYEGAGRAVPVELEQQYPAHRQHLREMAQAVEGQGLLDAHAFFFAAYRKQ